MLSPKSIRIFRKRLRRLTARTLLPFWAIRHSRLFTAPSPRLQSKGRDPREVAPEGRRVAVAITHWRDGTTGLDRIETFLNVVEAARGVGAESIVVLVHTNSPSETLETLRNGLTGESRIGLLPQRQVKRLEFLLAHDICVVPWRRPLLHRHGHFLTWAHKKTFRLLALTDHFSHLVYLEDDEKLETKHLEYWDKYRAVLARDGLIPGYVRFEQRGSERFVVDQVRQQSLSLLPSVRNGAGLWVQLESPYQGWHILDRELQLEFLAGAKSRSPIMSSLLSGNHHQERAAAGPIFDNPPRGFTARNVVRVEELPAPPHLDEGCLLHHASDTYSALAGYAYGSIRVEDLFSSLRTR